MIDLPTPHGDKLTALLQNPKLPKSDRPRLRHAIQRYEGWVNHLTEARESSTGNVATMVSLLNDYKLYIDMELIFWVDPTVRTTKGPS